ncbi:hypothetical protein ACFL6I_14345 [candidate division KSB1 bacterium]
MKYTATEHRQMLDILERKNKSEEYSPLFVFKQFMLKRIQNTMEPMRVSYNYTVINLLKHFGLDTDNINDEFDQVWQNILCFFNLDNDGYNNRAKIIRIIGHVKGSLKNPLMFRAVLMRKIWKRYKNQVLKIVNERGEKRLKDED